MASDPEVLALVPAYPGAKPSIVVPAVRWDDAMWLGDLIRVTVAALRK